jgi:hypothetical protein
VITAEAGMGTCVLMLFFDRGMALLYTRLDASCSYRAVRFSFADSPRFTLPNRKRLSSLAQMCEIVESSVSRAW